MKCMVCGKEFEQTRPWQKYCSSTCKRYANRHPEEMKAQETADKEPVIREFHCRKCGTLVQVRDHKDFRMRFCSQKCEKSYWKHTHKNIPTGTIFEFRCEECGTLVTVSDPKDKRKRFCSAVCRCRWNNRNRLKKLPTKREVLKEG